VKRRILVSRFQLYSVNLWRFPTCCFSTQLVFVDHMLARLYGFMRSGKQVGFGVLDGPSDGYVVNGKEGQVTTKNRR